MLRSSSWLVSQTLRHIAAAPRTTVIATTITALSLPAMELLPNESTFVAMHETPYDYRIESLSREGGDDARRIDGQYARHIGLSPLELN